MKTRNLMCLAATTLFAGLASSARLAAQEHKEEHQRYKLVDLRTFGGPTSYLEGDNGVNGAPNQVLNNRGIVAGWADTSTPDPYTTNCFNPDCVVSHAFQWQNGVMTDLGVLPGGQNSSAAWISDNGLIAGQSQNGVIDPLVTGFAELRAVLWQNGRMIDLGTLGGNESSAFAVNSRGQVVGVAVNTIPDPFSFLATQLRAFLWQNGVMHDLGTLGGPEAWALFVNERGQIAGFSFTNATANPVTGLPTQDPFLWENGTMVDLGTLGGTLGSPFSLNNRGQVVGTSNLAGDLTAHPFLWDRGVLTDLGTLGGSFGIAYSVNDSGEVVGGATNQKDQAFLAFLWRNGLMTSLGSVNGDDCSVAKNINSSGQIVGQSFSCAGGPSHAFLWEDGGPMIDLTTLVPPNSGLQLAIAFGINDRGEIAGLGLPLGSSCTDPFVCGHAFLLIPCGGDDSANGACEDRAESTTGVTPRNLGSAIQGSTRAQVNPTRERMAPFRVRRSHD